MIRIFIGTEPKTRIAEKVLIHSILKNKSVGSIMCMPMIGPDWEYSLEGIKVGTGFSLRRWMIPAACSWKGHAIYMDADQLVFGDVNELLEKADTQPSQGGSSCWMSYQPDKFKKSPWPQSSVMLIDCEAARDQWGWHIERVLKYLRDSGGDMGTYADFMHCTWMKPQPVRIGNEWNHLNEYTPKGKPKHTRLLHYTKEPEQPWYKPDHKLAYLWIEALQAAMADGDVTQDDLKEGLANWKKKEDWRSTNGLHPYYKKFVK